MRAQFEEIVDPPISLDGWGADDVSGENEKKSINRFVYGMPSNSPTSDKNIPAEGLGFDVSPDEPL